MKGFGKITLGDMKHIKELSKEQRRTFYALVATGVLLLGGVGTASVLAYQNQVQQEKIALEKKEYKTLVSRAKKAVDTAYKTRKQTDISLAEKKVGQLKETDKKTYTQKLTELKGYLSQVEKVNGLISKAEQSKSDADVTSAQKGIDEEKADYLKNDKKAHQTKLDALKKTIADEKAKKAEEEKQAQEAAAQAEAERQAQAAAQAEAERQTQAQASNSSSNSSSNYSAQNIPSSVSSSDWELLLVNREHVHAELNPPLATVGGIPVDARIAGNAANFLAAAQAIHSGEHFISGYRSVSYQNYLYNFYIQQEMASDSSLSREAAIARVQTYSQPPGASEHMTGLAIDMSTVNEMNQCDPQIVNRVKQIAPEYGFVLRFPGDKSNVTGVHYEDWHFRYVGVESAKYMTAHNLTLEEYVALLQQNGR